MKEPKIADLTVSQFQKLIRETVQEAVAEVMIEFSIAAEMDERVEYEAELTDYLRNSMKGLPALEPANPRADD